MNALILSAVFGVIMMFSGLLLKQKSNVRHLATAGLLLLLVVNVMEMYGFHFFKINVEGMLHFDRFSLLFNSIIFLLLYLLILSARDIERGQLPCGIFPLIFILCGITCVIIYSLLMLFWNRNFDPIIHSYGER
jgi:NADH-quinone oxidoreductase subunit N